MKIVTWNCNGALRRKFEQLSIFDADIYVIQECEDPSNTNDKSYEEWSMNHLWIGDSKNKGLGIFAKQSINLELLDWSNLFRDHSVKHFLPCMVNNSFQLLGVWTHRNNSPNFGYMGQFWKYLQTNSELFNDIVIAGDFNSNAIWDQWDRWWNHSDVVKILEEKNIKSVYHLNTKEEQRKESEPTFFLQKNQDKPYHIDYFFVSVGFQKPKDFRVEKRDNWIKISDHVPLIVEL
jgi:exonuclease III